MSSINLKEIEDNNNINKPIKEFTEDNKKNKKDNSIEKLKRITINYFTILHQSIKH